ncbi:hypothetical protein A9Q83_16660 [Alphaproteobacteria bacterium 46_93_T64]|nr:hypothetical protein A9Q83_16660 [Alphaproteobacteria bacterium 46_93_T64]
MTVEKVDSIRFSVADIDLLINSVGKEVQGYVLVYDENEEVVEIGRRQYLKHQLEQILNDYQNSKPENGKKTKSDKRDYFHTIAVSAKTLLANIGAPSGDPRAIDPDFLQGELYALVCTEIEADEDASEKIAETLSSIYDIQRWATRLASRSDRKIKIAASLGKSNNDGDPLYNELIANLCKLYAAIYNKKISQSKSRSIEDYNSPGIRFLQKALAPIYGEVPGSTLAGNINTFRAIKRKNKLPESSSEGWNETKSELNKGRKARGEELL